jgi:L-ascorbate metabolism protein UlaG (beta-lactamase superfamily)
VAGGRLVYVGHATVLLELGGTRILTDPLLRRRIGHVRRRVPLPAVSELVPLDAILISHAHADHLDPRSLRQLAGDRPVIAPRGCARLLRRAGVGRVVELVSGERCQIGPIAVEAVPASHDGRRHPFARDMPALGFLIEGPTRVYFAGDTGLFAGMAELIGRVDVALLPVAGWGPRLPAGHLDPKAAAQAAALIRPPLAVPIHWGTMVALGPGAGGDLRAPAVAFAAEVGALGLPTRVRILAPGEAMALGD